MAEPPAVYGCVSATINSRVYVWGGKTESGDTSHLANLYILDSRTEKWLSRPITGQHPPGYYHCAAAQDGNLLYVYGGLDKHDKRTGSFFRLDLDLLSWTELSPHIHNGPKKKDSCRIVIQEDKIVLFGGDTYDGLTNELHMFSLSTGLWSSLVTTGTTPPPCHNFSFLKVSNSTVVLFGGYSKKKLWSDELYTLDLNNMHWTKVPHKDGEPWPGGRQYHAACCIGVDTSHTQLMITGGYDVNYYDDIWLLDITSMTWRVMPVTQRGSIKRRDHNAATVLVTEDVSEVVLFGGVRSGYISETTIIRLERERHSSTTDSSVGEWKITDIAGPRQLGTRERLQYKKTLSEKENEEAYRKAIEEQLSVLIRIARLNFVGLPRSGKSTTMKRLIGEILNIIEAKFGKEQASTGVAERNQAIIKSISKCIGFTSRSKWSSKDLLGETGVLNQLIQEIAKIATSTQVHSEKPSQASQQSSNAPPLSHEMETTSATMSDEASTSQDPPSDFENVISSFQDAVYKEDWDTVKYLLEDTTYLINTDTGGQTEFLDLMSRFLMGPALNLIISRLVDSLDQVYKIYCTNENGVSTEKEDSVVTLEEVIFQVLASIACLDSSYDPDHESQGGNTNIEVPPCSSKAVFVGTFRDQVTREEFGEKDKLLQKKIEQTDFYHKSLVLYASPNQLMFSLDNLNGGQDEIDQFRKSMESKIKENFKKVQIPASWLMLSINIRHDGKRTMTLSECQDMAANLGITAANLPKALWFLHYRVGILLYYPEIPGFSQLIICDIQVVFDAAKQLVKKTFTFEKIGKKAAESFKEKAQFTMADLQNATAKSVDDLIPMEKIVFLLEHHKILAALPLHEEGSRQVTYFMPCVLKNASPAELQEVCNSPDVAPLMFRYECGYMPLGVFSSLIIELVSQHCKRWTLIEDKPCRNKIEFHVGEDFDTVTLISRPSFMEVVLFREPDPKRSTSSVCADVRTTLSAALEGVHADLKYHSTMKLQYAFECPSHPGKEHLCVHPEESGGTLLCLENQKRRTVIRVKNAKHQIWFHNLPVWNVKIREMKCLNLIRYCDPSTSEKKELRILDDLSADWEDIGEILGFRPPEIKAIRHAGAGKTPIQCLREVISKWTQNADNMPSSKRYPCNWTGLYNMLMDSKHGTTANDLKAAITASCSDLHQSFDAVTDYGNVQTLSNNPEPVKSQRRQSPSEHQTNEPSQNLSQETTPQTKSKAKRKKMNKDLLAEWLMEEGVEDDDIKILKSKNVGEILFLKMEVGDKWTTGLSEATIAILPCLQDTLRNL